MAAGEYIIGGTISKHQISGVRKNSNHPPQMKSPSSLLDVLNILNFVESPKKTLNCECSKVG